MAALNKTDLDFLASLPASTAEPTGHTREQQRRAEDLPWGLVREGRRTDLGDLVVAQQADLERMSADLEEARLTLAAQQGKPEGAPPGWEYCVISEDGDRAWRKPTADGMLFAWGAGVQFIGPEQTATPYPGGWARWVADEDGDLDEQIEWRSNDDWTDRAAMLDAEAASFAPAVAAQPTSAQLSR